MAPPPSSNRTVTVDVVEFVRTRDALTSAYMGLSAAIDRAVKAYIEHTNVVLAGDNTPLNVGILLHPLNAVTASGAPAAMVAPAPGQVVTNYTAPQFLPPPGPVLAPADAATVVTGTNGAAAAVEQELVGKDGKKKRQYKPRDPNAPKRPLTAYFRYLQQNRKPIQDEVSKDGTARTPGHISKIATDRWNSMDETSRKPYLDAYKKELMQHVVDMEAYKAAGGDVTDATLKKLRETATKGMDSLGAVDAEVPTDAATGVSKTVASDSSDSDDDDDDDEEVVVEKPKTPTPEPPKKSTSTKKSSKKAAETSSAPQFSSLEAPSSPATATRSSPERKRKAAVEAEGGQSKKKRGRKGPAEKPAPIEAATPSQQLVAEAAPAPSEKKKKDKKKKRADA